MDWKDTFGGVGALWFHDGNHRRPHIKIPLSESHTGGFFNIKLVPPEMLTQACEELLHNNGFLVETLPRLVISSGLKSITMTNELTRLLSLKINRVVKHSFTELTTDQTENRAMILERSSLETDNPILVVQYAVIDFKAVRQTIRTIQSKDGIVMPFIITLANLSGQKEVDGNLIISLFDQPVPVWDKNCPLCTQGSEAIQPDGNWGRLNGQY